MTIFSIHIPKTGGTSFREILIQNFSSDLILDYGLPADTVNEQIKKGTVKWIHGHYRGDKYSAGSKDMFVTWLRNPLDRLVSAYNFWKSNRYPDQRVWRQFHYENWSFMDYALSKALQNEQSKYFASIDLNRFCVVGITEFYQESLHLFRRETGLKFDETQIPHYRKADHDNAIFDPASLSKSDIAKIMDVHKADYELYLRGLAHFRKRTQKSPKIAWGPKLLQPATGPAEFAERDRIGDRLTEKKIKHIRGTYYYGDGWPINVWDSFRKDVVDLILRRIKSDGYNTVILLIPAGLSIIRTKRPDLYDKFLNDFEFLEERIRDNGLFLCLRLGFAWDGFPVPQDRGRLLFAQLSGGAHRENIKLIFNQIYELVADSDNFLFGFLTWEDLISFPLLRAPRAAAPVRESLAKEIGFKNNPIGIPEIADPDYERYLDFIDRKFMDFYYDIKDVFPFLTAEVRVDVTPFTNPNGQEKYFVHNRQMVQLDSNIIGTYFGTYMIHGPLPKTAEQALNGMDLAHRVVRNVARDKKPFVDQFNFVMNQKEFSQFPGLASDQEELFLKQVVDWFDDSTVGYATWSFIDYIMDVVSNGSFRLGLEDWVVTGSPSLLDDQDGRCVLLGEGEALLGTRIKHYQPWCKDGWILLAAELGEDSVVQVMVADDIVFEFTNSDFVPTPFEAGGRIIQKFTGQSDYVQLTLKRGSAKIRRVSVGRDLCSNGGRDSFFRPTETSQRIANFNSAIAAKGVQ